MRELLSITYLRGAAASFIVLFHAAGRDDVVGSGPLEGIFALGASRVDVFFVISGFSLWLSITRRNPGTLRFLAERFLRIAPMYWIVTLLLGGGALLVPALFPNLRPTIVDVILSMAFIPHFSTTRPDKIWPVLVQGWALHYEAIFYVVMGLALAIPSAWRLAGIVGTFVALTLIGIVAAPTSAVGITLTDPILLEFAGGVALGWFFARGDRLGRTASIALLVAACVALVGGTILAQTYLSARALFLGGPALLLVAAMIFLEASGGRWPDVPILRILGRSSYSIYLIHGFVISVVARLWVKGGMPTGGIASGLTFVALCTFVSLLAGYVVWRLVEQPLADRLRLQRQPAPAPAEARVGSRPW